MTSILSIVLGIIAILTVIIFRSKKNLIPIISLSSCCLAIFLQLMYLNSLVKTEDWSSLMDTSQATTFVSGILILITMLLNLSLLKTDKK